MGKNKKQTKGNTRPSSSRHSAELLSSASGTPSPGLIGFQNYPREITGLQTATGSQEEEGSGNVRVIMKMMLKKDVVTKLKGIQEFICFCASDTENAMRLLPFFPRIYNKLALEPDHRVREAMQRALEIYIPKLKKDIVPYLKSFMATWIITQCDPYTPAAYAAQSAFSKSFPEHKQSGAVMYCQSEIMKAIKDNLCEITEDSLSESGGLSADVCREKYELILLCSVRGLKLFVSLLSEEDKTKMVEGVSNIVREKRFWALSQSTVSKVCVAWFELIHILTSEMPEVFQETKCDLISLVMSALWKSDSRVIGSIWDCALQVVSTFEDWWHQTDVSDKTFFPLLEFLSCGGYGNAAVTYPMLHKLLSKLMIINEVGLSFYMEFFSSIRQSFSQHKLKTSPKECDAVIKGFMECLKYLTNIFINDPAHIIYVTELVANQGTSYYLLHCIQCPSDFLRHWMIVQRQPFLQLLKLNSKLIPLIKSSLQPEACNIAASSFFPLLGLYLQDLEALLVAKENLNDSHCCNMLTLIWENISLEIIAYLNTKLEKCEKDVSVLVLLFHSLHQPSRYLSANERKIYFCGESSSTSIDTTYFIGGTSPSMIPRTESSASSNSFLFKYTVGFCGHLCLELQRNLEPCYLELCAEIMSEATSHQLFNELLRALHIAVHSGPGAPFIFFKAVVMIWIKRACICCDEASLDWIRDIVIYICCCVSTESAVRILEICSVVEHQKIFQRLIIKILGSKESGEEMFRLWFQSPTFVSVFEFMAMTFAKKLISGKLNLDSPETALCSKSLMLTLTKAGSEQTEVPWKPIHRILKFFTHILSNEHCVNCENQGDYNIVDFLCDAAEKLFFQYPSSYLDCTEITLFLFKIFTLSLEWAKFDVTECHKEQRQLDYLWKTSIAYVVREQSDLKESNFLLMAAGHLHGLLLNEMSKKKQKRFMAVACCFLERVEEAYCDMSVDSSGSVLMFLIKRIFPSSKEWEEARNGLELGTVFPILQGNWYYPFVHDERLPTYSVTVPPLLFAADTVAELLRKVWDLIAGKCKRQIQAVYHKLLCSQYLPHVLWSVCYADSLNFFKPQDVVEPYVLLTLQENYSYLLEKCNVCQLLTVISGLLLCDDLTWGVPFESVLQTALMETATPLDYFNTFSFAFNEFRSNYLTVTQICLKYASKEFVMEFVNSMNEIAFDADCNSAQSRKDFYGNLSQLARCVQEHGHQFVPHVQKKVLRILEKLVRSERFCKEDYYDDVLFITGFTAIATGILKDVRNQISHDLWFSLMGIITDWFRRCMEIADQALTDSSSLIFVQQTCKLIAVMSEVIQEGIEDKAADTTFKRIANAHWKDLFQTDISKQLVKLFLKFAGKISELNWTSNAVDSLMFALVQTLEYLSAEQILEAVLLIHSRSNRSLDIFERIDSAYQVLHELTRYLKSKSICVQFGIHFLLKKALVHLPKIDKRQRSYDDAESENTFRSSPLVELLAHTNDVVELLLADVKSTECCILKPFTDSYTFTMANLLAWHIFLEYFSASVTEERSVYVGCLADSQMLACMLMNVIRLRPENPSACSGHIPRKAPEENNDLKIDLHEVPPMYSVGTPSSKHLQHVACSVYVAALKKIPALVRTWWSNLDKKTAGIVEKFTSENISKVLLLSEINAIHAHKDQFVNMMVDAYASSRQVVATYTLDDATIELSIKIPQNYPLGSVVASNKKKTIVDQNQWRTWMFQLTTFLNYHNGSIKDALVLWKKNLDKRFEGVEECMVCYFILHSSSGTLPNKTCRICKKKFHGSCLFKWFKTSNSCSCPGCRNDF